MNKMKRVFLVATWLTVPVLNMPGAAYADGFDQFVVFGDSTLDTGYFRYHTTGSATTDSEIANAISLGATGGWAGNGVMNTTILAGKFGLGADTIGGGGTNYANGGATTVPNNHPIFPANVTTLQQIENYLASVKGAANSHALYLIKSGDNDVTYYLQQGAAFMAANPNYLSDGAAALAASVARLQAAGARHIVVRNSYDSALFAGLGGDIDSRFAAAYAVSRQLWVTEWSDLAAAGVHFIPADNDSLFRYVVHHPTLFGFTAESVLPENAPSPASTAILSVVSPAQQQDYLFVNGPHFTTAGQTIEADYTYSLLIAPSQISLLAESAVQTGMTRMATIQGQIDLSEQHRGPNGINAWASAGVSSLDLDNDSGFPEGSSTPFSGTVGADYRTPAGVIAGAALTVGTQTQDFSIGGGDVEQTDEALSLYAAYRAGALWGNLVAAYGLLQNDLSREVTLGRFIDRNHADTSGQSLSLALRGGGDLRLGQITTGPVAGVVLQRVHIDDFTETGTTGVTALSFDDQTRNSLVSQLGWRVSAEVGHWRPYAEAEWNHEWADRDNSVTASLTSVAAPSYTMDAAPVASDWASATLGASYKVNSQVMLRGAVSAMFFNPEVTSYGGEVGLSVSF